MDKKKARNFSYVITSNNIENLNDYLRELICKYHLIVFENTRIEGVIIFENTKTYLSVLKLLKREEMDRIELEILSSKKTTDQILKEYKKKNYWDNGYIVYKKYERKKNQELLNDMILPIANMMQTITSQTNHISIQNRDMMNTLQKELLEKISNSTTVIHNHTTTNHNNINNKFNIHLFLNESCKDAINFQDFIDQIQIEDDDLLFAKDHGFVKSIVNVIEKELNKCDIYNRPLHCTDIKRDILHIREENKWVKENGKESFKIQKAIRNISHKKNKKVFEFLQMNPEYTDPNSNKYNEYEPLMLNLIGGYGQEYDKNTNKVIHELSKQVYISNKENIIM
jgi:hypothetical protein